MCASTLPTLLGSISPLAWQRPVPGTSEHPSTTAAGRDPDETAPPAAPHRCFSPCPTPSSWAYRAALRGALRRWDPAPLRRGRTATAGGGGPHGQSGVGLRPGGPTVRLEVQQLDGARCVHNHGHSGSEATLTWGCVRKASRARRREHLDERPGGNGPERIRDPGTAPSRPRPCARLAEVRRHRLGRHRPSALRARYSRCAADPTARHSRRRWSGRARHRSPSARESPADRGRARRRASLWTPVRRDHGRDAPGQRGCDHGPNSIRTQASRGCNLDLTTDGRAATDRGKR